MEPETLKALKASIRKWRKNTRVRKVENALIAVEDCALCDLFFYDGCFGCPVSEATHRSRCSGSPYDDASDFYCDWSEGRDVAKEFRAAACEEVAFLESLLPEGETA